MPSSDLVPVIAILTIGAISAIVIVFQIGVTVLRILNRDPRRAPRTTARIYRGGAIGYAAFSLFFWGLSLAGLYLLSVVVPRP